MRHFVILLAALAAASPIALQPAHAQVGGPPVETVPNPFQGTPSNAEPNSTLPAAKAKRTRAANTEPMQSDAEARKRCGADAVVWANKKSKIYHYAGSSHYGKSRNGVYMCEKESIAAGMRPAKNEKRG